MIPVRAVRKSQIPDPIAGGPGAEHSPCSTVVASDGGFTMGLFHCPPQSPDWRRENCIGRYAHMVFPRVPVSIRQRGHGWVVADMNRIMLYPAEQVYERQLLSSLGDSCVWFAFDEHDVAAAAQWAGLGAAHTRAFFSIPAIPCTPSAFMLVRWLASQSARRRMDPLQAGEAARTLLGEVMVDAHAAMSSPRPRRVPRPATCAAHRELAEQVRELLNRRPESPNTVCEIASAVHTTPFHLCRVFKRVTGTTIHAYLSALRIRGAADAAVETDEELSDIAARWGFCNAAHLSNSFRRFFGITPSRYRGARGTRRAQ